jgi:hypothetical protein
MKDEIQKVNLGTNEALRVTADGEFIWHPEADAMIEEGDFTSSPAMRHILRALRKALAAPVQDSTCNNSLREQGKAYPRTCRKCGKGPCIELANVALDKKAENARALGLDYEPVGWWDSKIGFFEEKHFDQLQPLYTTPPAARPAVPDAIHHTDLSESLEYIQGWNDCRREMMENNT